MLTETQKVEMWSDFKAQSVHELVRLSGERQCGVKGIRLRCY